MTYTYAPAMGTDWLNALSTPSASNDSGSTGAPPTWTPTPELQSLIDNGTLKAPTAEMGSYDNEGNWHMSADFENQFASQLPTANILGKPVASTDLQAYSPGTDYYNPNFHAIDPNYGDVTMSQNQKQHESTFDKIGDMVPMGIMAGMAMAMPEVIGAVGGSSGAFGAANMFKVPGMLQGMDSGQGFNPMSLASSALGAFGGALGIPSSIAPFIGPAVNAISGRGFNPIQLALSLAKSGGH